MQILGLDFGVIAIALLMLVLFVLITIIGNCKKGLNNRRFVNSFLF